ncbi:BRO family protein [Nostoc punctiforme]|uniref:BRO family protein n=1 Tax=Nostoc punctiforme TaxID=272131 RepID=UPI001F548E71|nr:BRO family protein [Nostoc punctiforme]
MDAITSSQTSLDSPFDQIRKIDDDGTEYWLATELLTLLGYQTWKRIKDTVERAKVSAKNSGINPSHHLVDVVQMAQIGTSQAFREVLNDYKLSRHACYLVAMNGDPRKLQIAAAQNYFAFKTREAELSTQNSELLAQLLERLQQQNKVIEGQGKAIAQLQAQVQTLLPLCLILYPLAGMRTYGDRFLHKINAIFGFCSVVAVSDHLQKMKPWL